MDIVEIINIVMIAIFALVALIGFLFGRSKGTFRALVDIVFLIINVIGSLFISRWIASLIITPQKIYDIMVTLNGDATEGTMADLISELSNYLQEGGFLDTVDLRLVFALAAILVIPFIFMAVFFVLGILLFIIKIIVCKLFIPKTKGWVLRLLGGSLCALKNVLLVAVFLVPLVGYASFALQTVDNVGETFGEENMEEITSLIDDYRPIVEEGTLNVINSFGGWWLFDTLTTVHVDDVKVSLVEESENILKIYGAIEPIMGIDTANFTENEVKLIESAIDEIEKSEYLTALVASIISQLAQEVYENDGILWYELPTFGEGVDPVINMFLEVWSDTGRGDLIDDLRTLNNVFGSVVKHGLFVQLNTQGGDIMLVLENGEFYSDILVELHKNHRTRPIVPTLANALQSLLYEVYENINGEPYGTGEIIKVDEGAINEGSLIAEGERIAIAIEQIRIFSETIANDTYVDEMVQHGDFVALGKGLNQIRDSLFFGSSYRFLLNSILHSESCAKLGIFDSNFVENATKPNADMSQLLLSRQHLAVLTIAMWDGDKESQEESLKVLISSLGGYDKTDIEAKRNAEAEMEALKELSALDNLAKYGVGGDKGNTVSLITNNLVDAIHDHIYTDKNGDGVVDQTDIDMEAKDTAHVITVLTNSQEVGWYYDVFGGENDSRTGQTASQFVSDILKSSIALEMIDNTANDINADGDPFGVYSAFSDSDKSALESALTEQYKNGTDRETLEDIAFVLGVNFIY